ncbi:hypothetical protein BC830DRAFT_719438 [Chytriomyces sp. MP71]|nr:hypothetical protein BC830DRAFT_719438 [Chytriomyces sp. MP71]
MPLVRREKSRRVEKAFTGVQGTSTLTWVGTFGFLRIFCESLDYLLSNRLFSVIYAKTKASTHEHHFSLRNRELVVDCKGPLTILCLGQGNLHLDSNQATGGKRNAKIIRFGEEESLRNMRRLPDFAFDDLDDLASSKTRTRHGSVHFIIASSATS